MLTYNQDNRLVSVVSGSTTLGTYTYNGLGQRVKKVAGSTTTVFLYDFDGNIIGESNANGTFSKEYLYRGSSRLAMVDVSKSKVYYYGNDQLGTPEILTDSSNTVVWEAIYKPFGEAEVNEHSTVVNNFRFPGQYYDGETGLHYNYNRYYDLKTGRYLTSDPIRLEGGINMFLYTEANPINFIDPLGLYEKDVHYDLTRQLATETGFKCCAADIADADQGVDDNPETSPWKSKKNRELWHFPSQARVNEVINNALASCTVTDLVKALHVLQDSFSHAGDSATMGHFPNRSPDRPESDYHKYNNMITATRNLLKQFGQRCGFKCCE